MAININPVTVNGLYGQKVSEQQDYANYDHVSGSTLTISTNGSRTIMYDHVLKQWREVSTCKHERAVPVFRESNASTCTCYDCGSTVTREQVYPNVLKTKDNTADFTLPLEI